uniref:Uncharacterized protein n=1 Tax=Vitis vinifera TaxID=29760 RepID=F6I008_VITVI
MGAGEKAVKIFSKDIGEV